MKTTLFIVLFVATSLICSAHSSATFSETCDIRSEAVGFAYTCDTLAHDEWLARITTGMQERLGAADWYMVAYSGGNIALIHKAGQVYESYDLMASTVGQVNYDDFYLISLKMIEKLVPPKKSIIISDSEETLAKIAKHLAILQGDKELIKFYKK